MINVGHRQLGTLEKW